MILGLQQGSSCRLQRVLERLGIRGSGEKRYEYDAVILAVPIEM